MKLLFMCMFLGWRGCSGGSFAGGDTAVAAAELGQRGPSLDRWLQLCKFSHFGHVAKVFDEMPQRDEKRERERCVGVVSDGKVWGKEGSVIKEGLGGGELREGYGEWCDEKGLNTCMAHSLGHS